MPNLENHLQNRKLRHLKRWYETCLLHSFLRTQFYLFRQMTHFTRKKDLKGKIQTPNKIPFHVTKSTSYKATAPTY
jgi:hypothetical protein